MSRYYDVQVVFKQQLSDAPLSDEAKDALVALTTREVYRPESPSIDEYEEEDWRYYELEAGDINLSGGIGTDEADAKFRQFVETEFPALYLVTRWHLAEWDWDDVYDSTEELD